MKQRLLADWLAHAERVHPVGIDMGLARVREVARRLGVLPPSKCNTVIAGTNGKGSTSVYLEALLLASGRTVGTTISPHLHKFNERVRLNGNAVEDDVLCDAFAQIEDARKDTTLTYFEFGVLVALVVFRRADVDATVLEVGLGGRLDAVNIVDGDVTIITSIGIDHVGYLGPDRESIGAEKAGIMRPRVPCIYGEDSIPRSIVDAAFKLDVPLLRYDVDFHARRTAHDTWHFDGTPRMDGRVAFEGLALPSVALRNAASAVQAFVQLDEAASPRDCIAAAARARLPGRFERFDYRGAQVIVDVAHNPHGAAFLGEQLGAQRGGGRTIAVAGFLQDKDAAGIVAALDSAVDEWIFVGTDGQRGQSAAQSADKAGMANRSVASEGNLIDVLDGLVQRLNALDRVVVFGCFDLAQRARATALGVEHD
jgi:dihydrofolate synthase/folylpolyglutamate synthase